MTLHDLIDQSYQAVLAQLSNTHLILLHPHSRYRSIIIAKLVNDPDLATFYYAMGPDDVNLQGFLTSITQCLANQHPTFGRHINALPQDVYEAPEEHFTITLETFVKDLSEVETNDFVLILDEYDRSDRSDDVQRFVEKLSGHLPSNCHLILNGRTLPRLPWISMIAQKRAIMLKDEQIILDGFYGQDNSSKEGSTLEVFALGEGKVLYENNAVNSWEGHLPRLLFFFALDLVLRLLSYRARIKYLFSIYGLVDVISVAPGIIALFFPIAANASWVRVLRIVRIGRVLKSTDDSCQRR